MTHFKDIDSTLISLGEPERKKTGSVNYVVAPILCGGKPLTMRVSGRLKIFDHGLSFSIGLSVDETNRKMFEDIEDKIRKETRTMLSHPAVPVFDQEEFKLIKVNKSGEFPKVYSKLYTAKNGRIIAKFHEKVVRASRSARTEGPRATKRPIPDPREMVGVPFDGEIILQIQRLHFGSVRSICIAAKEVLVKEVIQPESFFDDLSDDDGEMDTQDFDTVN